MSVRIALMLFCLLLPAVAFSLEATPTPTSPAARDDAAESRAMWHEALKVARLGPMEIAVPDQGSFQVPPDIIFIPAPVANRIMQSLGNEEDQDLLGVFMNPKGSDRWVAALFLKKGHVDDDDAKVWTADALLESLWRGVETMNIMREASGLPKLGVGGWIEPPVYDAGTHRLIWSVSRGAERDSGLSYNAYHFGREGYYLLDFITLEEKIDSERHWAKELLAGLRFSEGRRYEDFNVATDQPAAFGMGYFFGGFTSKKTEPSEQPQFVEIRTGSDFGYHMTLGLFALGGLGVIAGLMFRLSRKQ